VASSADFPLCFFSFSLAAAMARTFRREMDKKFSPSYSSSQTTYVEAEAVEFSRFRFNRQRTASTASASTSLGGGNIFVWRGRCKDGGTISPQVSVLKKP